MVVGENHVEIAKKYSLTNGKKSEKVILLKHSEVQQEFDKHKRYAKEKLIEFQKIGNTKMIEMYSNLCDVLENTTLDEYFDAVSEGSLIDENGDVYTLNDPCSKYSDERCGQSIFEKTGEYNGLSQPFPLKNGGFSLVAKKGDIDWERIHMVPEDVAMFDAVWRLCVLGDKPMLPIEERIYNNMKNRIAYLKQFKSKEEYIRHSCAFWCYGIANDDGCVLLDDLSDIPNYDKTWVSGFYEKYIEPLPDDTVIALYDIKLL